MREKGGEFFFVESSFVELGREVGMSVHRDLEAFEAGFQRSKKGNLWQIYEGETLTVFERNGSYGWSVAGADGPQYSARKWDSEDAALEALFNEISKVSYQGYK